MKARIYKPCKNAMQSGLGKTKSWILEFLPQNTGFIEPVMGWIGNSDTIPSQVILSFDSEQEAIDYAKRNNIEFVVELPNPVIKHKPRPYTDNFK